MGKPGVYSTPPWCSVIISLLHTPATTTNAYFASASSRSCSATILPTLLIVRAAFARW